MQSFKDVLTSRGLLCPVWDESPQEEASCRVHSAPLAAPSFPGNLEGWTDAWHSLDCLENHHWMLHTVSWFLNWRTQSSLVCKLPRLRYFAIPWGKADNTLSLSPFSVSELGSFSTHFYPSGRKLKLSKKFTNLSWNKKTLISSANGSWKFSSILALKFGFCCCCCLAKVLLCNCD